MKIKTLIISLVVIALHLPFIQADPDYYISGSRGANTDEGLYTGQIRNLIHHKDLTLKKSDSLIKTPLFSAIQYLPLRIFGTTLTVGRLTVFLLSLLICGWIFSYNGYYGALGLISLVFVFLEYHIFHFFHYCMAEILSVSLIFAGIFMMVESEKNVFRLKDSFWPATCISLAYFIKFQFVYALFILPLAIAAFWLFRPDQRKIRFRQLVFTIAFLASYILLYYLAWYLPNKEFYKYVLEHQSEGKFVQLSGLYEYLKFLKDHLFLTGYLKLYTLTFIVLFFTGLVLLFKNASGKFAGLYIGLSAWFVIELHKLTLIYLPTRYLISFFFCMALIMALVILELLSMKGKSSVMNLTIRAIALIFILAFAIKNGSSYYETIQRRTFNITAINNYLAQFDFKDRPVLGSWAPSLSWKSKAITFPVWRNYFNDKDVINTYHPAMIIAETDEEDSNQTYQLSGIDLNSASDSVKTWTVNYWTLKLYWIRPVLVNVKRPTNRYQR
jgi:hypothetical protein